MNVNQNNTECFSDGRNLCYRGGKLERTYTPGGYIAGGVRYHYVKDHQGNVRCVVRQDGAVVESNEYYPYGGLFCAAASVQPYKYGAKELDRMHGIDLYDSEARWYDPVLGRTTTMDPLAGKYPDTSPYAWCAANPLRFSDPTGRLVIFVNGMNLNTGGTSQYWNGIDKKIQDSLNDKNSTYLDGSCGGALITATTGVVTGNLNPEIRKLCGKIMGKRIAQSIYNNLEDDETIKIISHSMGAAYAKGVIGGLQSYAEENGINHRIVMEIDLAPFQPTMQKACKGLNTIAISHRYDNVAGCSPIPKAYNYISRGDQSFWNLTKEHSINSFTIEEIEKFINEFLKSK